jgi:hypothetical protein
VRQGDWKLLIDGDDVPVRILRHLGLPEIVPPPRPARAVQTCRDHAASDYLRLNFSVLPGI